MPDATDRLNSNRCLMKTIAVVLLCVSVSFGAQQTLDLEALRTECRDLFKAKEYREVVSLLGRSRPARGDIELQIILATARLKSGRVSSARTAYERILRQAPHQWVVANNLGVVYYRQKNYARALIQFATAVGVRSSDPVVLSNFVEAFRSYQNNDPPKRALRNVAKAIKTYETLEAGLVDEKKAEGLVRWGTEWIPVEKRTELEKLRLESKLEVEKLEQQLGYAQFDLAKAKQEVARYRNKGQGTLSANLATGVQYKDQLQLAENDVRSYEEKIREMQRRLESVRAQIPVEPFRNKCELIDFAENWSLLAPQADAADREQREQVEKSNTIRGK